MESRIGIKLAVDDSQLKGVQAQLRTLSGQWKQVSAAQIAASNTGTKSVLSDQKKVLAGGESVAKALAESARRYKLVEESYSKQKTSVLINDMKRLQDEKVRVTNAMVLVTEKGAKAELKAQKDSIDMQLRAMKQVANERGDVQRGGAGIKAGIMGVGRDVLQGSVGSLGAVGSAMSAMGPHGMVAAAGLAAVALGAKKVIEIGSEYQNSLADMQAITGLTAEETRKLGDDARLLAKDFGVSASDVVETSKLIVSALGPELAKNGPLMKQVTLDVMNLGKASGVSSQEATKAVSTTLGQFNLQASESTRVVNVLAAAARVGNAEVPDLSESMANVGTVAAQMKVPLELTAAGIETLAKNGIKGAEAGTSFRGVLQRMASGSDEAKEALGKMGLTFNDINPEKVGLVKALETMKKGFDGVKDPVERASIAKKVFDTYTITGANAMMNNIDVMKKYQKEITGTNDAEDQAAIKKKTLTEQVARMKQQFADLAIGLFEKLAPAFAKIMDGVSSLAPVLVFLTQTAITPLTVAIQVIGWVVGDVLIPVFSKLWDWVSALATKLYDWVTSWGVVQAIIWKVKTVVSEVVDWVTKAYQTVVNFVNSVVDAADYLFGTGEKKVKVKVETTGPNPTAAPTPGTPTETTPTGAPTGKGGNGGGGKKDKDWREIIRDAEADKRKAEEEAAKERQAQLDKTYEEEKKEQEKFFAEELERRKRKNELGKLTDEEFAQQAFDLETLKNETLTDLAKGRADELERIAQDQEANEHKRDVRKYNESIKRAQDYNEKFKAALEKRMTDAVATYDKETAKAREFAGAVQGAIESGFGKAWGTINDSFFKKMDESFNASESFAGAFMSGLLQSFISFGEQMLTQIISQQIATAVFTATTTAALATIQAAAALPAALVAAASFGGSTAAAVAGLGALTAMAGGLAALKFNSGGHVDGPGTETSDSIPARLSKNEYVIKASSAKKLGPNALDYINEYGAIPPGYKAGGGVFETGDSESLHLHADVSDSLALGRRGFEPMEARGKTDRRQYEPLGVTLGRRGFEPISARGKTDRRQYEPLGLRSERRQYEPLGLTRPQLNGAGSDGAMLTELRSLRQAMENPQFVTQTDQNNNILSVERTKLERNRRGMG